ncbi:hypothetical protein Lal_00023422 [Lupinus albus]|nr:hypothetical protein Lal_00023422 [Lupinus albus]
MLKIMLMDEIRRSRRMKNIFLDWLKKFMRNNSTSQHVPEYQCLQFQFLPLFQAEITPHPYYYHKRRKKDTCLREQRAFVKKTLKQAR